MSLFNNSFSSKDVKLNLPNKALNPNAAEFVPSAHRSTSRNIRSADMNRLDVPGPSGKAVLDHSESNNSNNSDDEAHHYWRRQLPDDITPDFKDMGENELQKSEQLSLSGLSKKVGIESSKFSPTAISQFSGKQLDISLLGMDNVNMAEKTGYSSATYAEGQPSSAFMTMPTNSWDKRFINGDNHFTNGREGHYYNVDSRDGISKSLSSDKTASESNTIINPLEILASQFLGFAAENLADVYYANGCDLNSTIEMLTRFELQINGNFSPNVNSKALTAPSHSMLGFHAFPVTEPDNVDLQPALDAFRSPSSVSRGSIDFASTVQKLVPQSSDHLKYDRNVSANAGSVGSSRSSKLLTGSYNDSSKSGLGDKLLNFGALRATPAWLETGAAVANMYSETREEAHDLMRLRNAYFEQAREAYLIGNKALAKELNLKGQFYNMQLKASNGKARETIYQPRSPVASDIQAYSRVQNPLIDLHGLHVSEAIHVLKHELSILKSTARSAGQRLQVMVCVGAGHHTKGTRTPARLPVAVEQYLLEEGLPYTQPQPGLLRVVIY